MSRPLYYVTFPTAFFLAAIAVAALVGLVALARSREGPPA